MNDFRVMKIKGQILDDYYDFTRRKETNPRPFEWKYPTRGFTSRTNHRNLDLKFKEASA